MPRVLMLSLSCIGMPVSGPASPDAMRLSAALACSRAASPVTVTKALTLSSTCSMRLQERPRQLQGRHLSTVQEPPGLVSGYVYDVLGGQLSSPDVRKAANPGVYESLQHRPDPDQVILPGRSVGQHVLHGRGLRRLRRLA